ncbi:MAG: Bax inhibitor-1/YccA family protein [Gemmatimonadaceae bacterium]
MQSSNPAFRSSALKEISSRAVGEAAMTVNGTATKTLVLLLATTISALMVWYLNPVAAGEVPDHSRLFPAMLIGGIGGLVVGLATSFKPTWAPITAPIYAVLEGMVLGAVSIIYNAQLHGLPMMAVGATLVTAVLLFAVYRARLITVTDRMRSVAGMALLGLMGTYLLQLVLGFFGVNIPFINGSGVIGIGFSLLATGLAAFFLLLDMDQVERMVQHGMPKQMEWYGAFSFLVTLVWLYLEMLRLLSKLNRR